jgi:natural product biosynthesis luciferase-like monooxygenase protein
VRIDSDAALIARHDGSDLENIDATAADLAYVIYTSGSTGRPKGVMVEHRNVTNFFAGMDERVGREQPGVWLAVTSLSFDISVLELFWTLARGYTVVLYTGRDRRPAARRRGPQEPAPPGLNFSLFYFSSDESEHSTDRYRLLLEGARFGDRNGFSAVWTPDRHFHAFGGLYPNPSVTGAAVAAITERVQVRAGSVVLPLHHPIRVAEEWAVVDNLSRGRVGISFASGWQPNDFVLRPENYKDAKQVMMRDIDTVRRLWRGEELTLPGPLGDDVTLRTLPRPVQPELPFWLTTAGNPESFRMAGEVGANILTHLLGQTTDELAGKLAIYRQAWKDAGHPGDGFVSVMLHAFVGADDAEVKEIVRRPLIEYLRSSISLIKQYAWSFPAFKKQPGKDGGPDFNSLTPDEMEALLEYSFERYYETSGLFGSPDTCRTMVERMRAIGVDDIACLIDFGVPSDTVLEHLEPLAELRAACTAGTAGASGQSVGDLIEQFGVTHMQCTPSMAGMLLQDDAARRAMSGLDTLMVGGEALPENLAAQLAEVVSDGRILNMYGPTETTIWSTTSSVDGEGPVTIGRSIANTTVFIVDSHMQPVPIGMPGELLIGGAGVVRGYLARPDLTAERFVPDPFSPTRDGRLYRTGDVARWLETGEIEFLGRADQQVKIRGYRIELGEIENSLTQQPGVREAVVLARQDIPGDVRLVAYVTPSNGTPLSAASLRENLRAFLPEFMIPSHIIVMVDLPRTPNLKIDRNALPAPAAVAVSAVAHTPSPAEGSSAAPTISAPDAADVRPAIPDAELEPRIAAIWAELLGTPHVGVLDNFFDMGGHSLLAVQVHGRLRRELGLSVSITDLFRFPTVRSLAASVRRTPAPAVSVSKPAGDKPAPAGGALGRAEARKLAMQRRQN